MQERSIISFLIWGTVLFAAACTTQLPVAGSPEGSSRKDPIIPYTVVRTLPHDTTAYTEGLLVHQGRLWESTGSPAHMPGTRSLIGVVDTTSGRISVKAELDRDRHFGEGIAFLGGKLYQLTYRSRTVFVYDAATVRPLDTVRFPSPEGWGLTTNGVHLVMSNGSSKILFVDPATQKAVKTITVRGRRGRVGNLNELELMGGALYANVWQSNHIVKIDTATGAVTGRLDLSPLARAAKKKYRGAKELNGIAYDPASGRVFVTGKMWPHIYEIAFPL
jgi:glutamine cyclotransferase